MPGLKDILKRIFPDKAAEIDQVPEDAITPPAATAAPPAPAAAQSISMDELQLIKEENKVLSQQLGELKTLLETEKRAREEAVGNIQAKRIQDTLEAAVKAGKITQEAKGSWQKRLEKDYAEAEAILNEMPANPVLDGKSKENAAPPANSNPGVSPNPVLNAILQHNQSAMMTD